MFFFLSFIYNKTQSLTILTNEDIKIVRALFWLVNKIIERMASVYFSFMIITNFYSGFLLTAKIKINMLYGNFITLLMSLMLIVCLFVCVITFHHVCWKHDKRKGFFFGFSFNKRCENVFKSNSIVL